MVASCIYLLVQLMAKVPCLYACRYNTDQALFVIGFWNVWWSLKAPVWTFTHVHSLFVAYILY